MRVKRKYPIFIKQSDEDYLVYIPFWEIYTEGISFDDAVRMAEDAIRTMADDKIEHGEPIPKSRGPEEARCRAREDADDGFDYSDGIMVFVDLEKCILCERCRNYNRQSENRCNLPEKFECLNRDFYGGGSPRRMRKRF